MKLYGKDILKRRLDNIAKCGRLPHAVMFSGNPGCGRKIMARYTAQLFLCENVGDNGPCGECAACRNVERDNHPDIIFAKHECGDKYAMEPLRAVLRGTVIKPISGGVRVYIFEDCDDMETLHLNTLLKVIEEPPEHLRFIFTCENTSVIPETVMSRVTAFEVSATTEEECRRYLCDNGIEPRRAEELSAAFSGNIEKCLKALERDDDEKKPDELALLKTAQTAAAAIGRRDGFSAAAALTSQRGYSDLAEVMGYLANIVRDALAVKVGEPAEFFGKAEARAIAAAYSQEEIVNMLNALFEIEKNEVFNISTSLTAAYFTSKIM